MKANAVFEGAGVRGVAYLGAIEVLERAGFDWQRVAGTSSGAIAAAMLACGMPASQMQRAVAQLDLNTLLDTRVFRHAWDTFVNLGMCRGVRFERWMTNVLGGCKLGETAIPLTVTVCDIANQEMVRLSSETHPELPVAFAVRLSMSIPFLFRAVRWQDGLTPRVCVDGGLGEIGSDEIFDGASPHPTITFEVTEQKKQKYRVANGVELACSMFAMFRDTQLKHRAARDSHRTVSIRDGGISWVNFALSPPNQARLLRNGKRAAFEFLQGLSSCNDQVVCSDDLRQCG